MVVAVDIKLFDGVWKVVTHGGRTPTPLIATEWVKQCNDLGAGEILLTSMENDGTKAGFATDITAAISQSVNIPVIASGGAGSMEHFKEIFTRGHADAALAASIFHFKEIEIQDLKTYLKQQNITVRQ